LNSELIFLLKVEAKRMKLSHQQRVKKEAENYATSEIL